MDARNNSQDQEKPVKARKTVVGTYKRVVEELADGRTRETLEQTIVRFERGQSKKTGRA